MTTELEVLRRLRDQPQLLEAVQQAADSELAIQQRLRSQFDAELVRNALSLKDARQRAHGILPQAEQLWLTRTGVEQATHPLIAAHKAKRFPSDTPVLDLCSGIGCDTAALARRGPVTAIDNDEAMQQRCAWNFDVWGLKHPEFQTTDVRELDLKEKLIHVDPDRRCGRPRPVKRLEQYCPDLTWMQTATTTAAGGAIKIGPASNFIQKFPGCEIELISLNGECREATVWFGDLAETEQFRATVLPAGETISGDPLGAWANVANSPARYVFDPDPAVVRSGLLDGVCEQLNLERLDAEEEYLTGDQQPASSFVTAFEVEAVLPNNQKELRRYLRDSPGQYYEVKCRRVPVDAASIAKKLPTGGSEPRVIFFLRLQGRARIVVAKRMPPAG